MKKTQKFAWIMGMLVSALLSQPSIALAAEKGSSENIGATLPLGFCLPFAGMLLCIAVCPLLAERWWEKKKPYVVAFWSIAFILPFAFYAGFGEAAEQVLEVIFGDYITFIVLLFGLFCVAGNICLEGDLVGTPKLNALLLLIGTFLSSWIGTTGASMVMIRPLLRANKWRHRKVQVVVFFIFLVSNIGGCLTPVGDPPLLMGFTNGIDFFWSMKLLPILLLNVVLLLGLFFVLDTRAYRKDIADGAKKPDVSENKAPLRLTGAHNIIFLVMIVGAVILSGVLPKEVPFFAKHLHIYGGVEMEVSAIFEVVVILIAALLSFKTTKKEIREKNNFTWDAIQEVAILFIGIFITMIPALLILKSKGSALGVEEPWQFFWITGCLSSFLDNTPTYLVFFTTAASLGFTEGVKTALGYIDEIVLMAISCGAVFMGAVTYIGNAPNFMVRSIAEENGIKMPSFFSYLFWSISCLVPVFLIDMLLFFI
ncbi:MAG: sodium:proton antiporter [Butyribacter sp.]|nr:sodium:proton antiporter [bacterium]MDY3854390.1 sodium:proton antiporter [Butyribacter sp.]